MLPHSAEASGEGLHRPAIELSESLAVPDLDFDAFIRLDDLFVRERGQREGVFFCRQNSIYAGALCS